MMNKVPNAQVSATTDDATMNKSWQQKIKTKGCKIKQRYNQSNQNNHC